MIASRSTIEVATSIPEALDLMDACGPDGEILAGATWVMRAPLRNETARRRYVAIAGIPALRAVTLSDETLRIGSCVTHEALADAVRTAPEFAGLWTAAATSANPQIRATATVGGNLCTAAFPAADLATALLALDASVCMATREGSRTMPLADFLRARPPAHETSLVTAIVVAREAIRSAHARLPLRKAGDYPVAIVSIAVPRGENDTIGRVRIAVGSVEPTPRRWSNLEDRLVGHPIDAEAIAAVATALAGEFVGRDGVEAPGWYRVRVLPALVRRAFSVLPSA